MLDLYPINERLIEISYHLGSIAVSLEKLVEMLEKNRAAEEKTDEDFAR